MKRLIIVVNIVVVKHGRTILRNRAALMTPWDERFAPQPFFEASARALKFQDKSALCGFLSDASACFTMTHAVIQVFAVIIQTPTVFFLDTNITAFRTYIYSKDKISIKNMRILLNMYK
jgi:hypothetical protein